MAWWWSWLLTAGGILGLWLAGSGRRIGWSVGLAMQGAWIAYAVTSRQWGFLLSAGAYGSVYARNWIKWRKKARESSGRADAVRAESDQPGCPGLPGPDTG